MKKVLQKIIGICAALTITGIFGMFYGCEGPQGPAGPAGVAGTGVNDCEQCHVASTFLKSRIIQYQASVHATGGNFERSTTDCAPCHTNEGFLERVPLGVLKTSADIVNPTPPGCRTCHKIHETYTKADLDNRFTDPVTLAAYNVTVDFGTGNLCAQCHQPRPAEHMPVPNGADITLSSSETRWGPHHGPQAAILGGVGGVEIPGSTPYTSSPHKNSVTNGCVDCHMQTPYGAQAGGHTWNMTYDYHGSERELIGVCQTCHPDATSFDIDNVQSDVEELLAQLKQNLINKGIYDTTNGLAKPGTYSANVAGAWYNYELIDQDRSMGVHNANYTKALLKNSIEATTN